LHSDACQGQARGPGDEQRTRFRASALAGDSEVWDLFSIMKRTPRLTILCLAGCWLGADMLAASWKDILPGRSWSVQYFGARRYVKPIAPQTRPNTPPATIPPTPPPLPGATPVGNSQTNAVDQEALKRQAAQREAILKRTIEFQKKRAEQGSAVAQFDLGKRFLTGDGLEQNLQEAKKWFEAAAKQNHAGAAAKLEEVKKIEAIAAADAKKSSAK